MIPSGQSFVSVTLLDKPIQTTVYPTEDSGKTTVTEQMTEYEIVATRNLQNLAEIFKKLDYTQSIKYKEGTPYRGETYDSFVIFVKWQGLDYSGSRSKRNEEEQIGASECEKMAGKAYQSMTNSKQKLDTHTFEFLYNRNDLENTLDYLEHFMTATVLVNRGSNLSSDVSKLADNVVHLRQFSGLTDKVAREHYYSQNHAAEAIGKIQNIIKNHFAPLEREGLAKPMITVMKTLNVFDKRWKS